ncbi:MAG TPA: O-antigen ligase family protein [Roseiflexaceae bacterium]|nr:O-antigen ligase family protein [Roseiflexaceae bacterium]
MINVLPTHRNWNVAQQLRRASAGWWVWFLGLMALCGVFGLVMWRNGPNVSQIAWLCFIIIVGIVLRQPRYGVYIIIGLALTGDIVLTPWYPFTKNLSSLESIMYVSRSLNFSPMEIVLALTYLSWLGRAAMQRKLAWFSGPLLAPMLVFTGCVAYGLIYGLGTHGNSNVGLWEVRAIFYLPAMFVLTSNLIETREHVSHVMWAVIIGLFLDSLSGFSFAVFTLQFKFSTVEAIAEHSNSIHLNSLFVLMIGAWLYRASYALRLIPLVMLPTTLLTYAANQRRAAFITLGVAFVVLAIIVYQRHRMFVLCMLPIVAVVGSLYLAAFWNSHGVLATPARAVRSMFTPDDASSRDGSSNEYRQLENMNILFTIKTAPLRGIGFGHKFYIVVPMPDISFFVWWEYITHNSLLWIWMQTGLFGFLALITLIGQAIMRGTWALFRMPDGDLSVVALAALSYVIMHFTFAYVDMSWDLQSMLYMGVMMGLINSLEHIVAKPVAVPAKRWPWQPTPVPPPGLRPLAVDAAVDAKAAQP